MPSNDRVTNKIIKEIYIIVSPYDCGILNYNALSITSCETVAINVGHNKDMGTKT